jgi:hypothetical protein
MGVQVDEPRQHEPARRVDALDGTAGRDLCLQRLDTSEANPDVAACAQGLARVENLSAAHDEIELVVGSHRGASRGA